jgi:hypothetical protein
MNEQQFWVDEMRARQQVARYEAYCAHFQTLWNLAVQQYCAGVAMQWAAALRDADSATEVHK